jgi:hypothetical protein
MTNMARKKEKATKEVLQEEEVEIEAEEEEVAEGHTEEASMTRRAKLLKRRVASDQLINYL